MKKIFTSFVLLSLFGLSGLQRVQHSLFKCATLSFPKGSNVQLFIFLFTFIFLLFTFNCPAQINLDSGLVAHYPFNGNANDESGNGNNGTVNGATLTTDRFGNVDKAYSFDGVNNYITSDIDTQQQVSYSFWYNNESILNLYPSFIGYRNSYVNIQTTSLYARIQKPSDPSFNIITNYLPSFNNWHHIVISFNYSTDSIKMTVDGTLNYFSSNTTNGGYNALWEGGSLTIGAHQGLLPECYYYGKIDDIRIYNRALSQTEIDSLYHEGGWDPLSNGLVAHYPFNGNANDESGNGNNGTIHGSEFDTGKFNQAIKFNNTTNTGWYDQNNWVTLPNITLSDFSVSLWTKWIPCANYESNGSIWSIGDFTTGNSFGFYINTNTGKVRPELRNNDLSIYFTDPNYEADISNQNWNHILCTIKQDSLLQFYFNGTLLDTIKLTSVVNLNNLPQYFAYHQWYSGSAGSSRFGGFLDEVRIYNRVLNTTEIDSLYHQGGWPLQAQTKKMYYVKGTSVPYSIYSANLDGSGETLITTNVIYPIAGFGGGKISFLTTSGLKVINVDGTGEVLVPNTTDATADANSGQSDLSPDGTMIVYTASANAYQQYIINIDGTNKILYNDGSGISQHQMSPSWNEPGRIYMDLSNYGDAYSQRIYYKSDTATSITLPTQITSVFGQSEVSGGPGNKVSYNDPTGNLFVMNSDGSGVTQLVNAGSVAWGGAWDLETNTLYYTSNGNIGKIKVDDTGNSMITTSGNIQRVIGIYNALSSIFVQAPVAYNNSRCGSGSITLTASGATTNETYKWFATATDTTVLATDSSYTIQNLLQTDTFFVALDSAGYLSARVPVIAFVFSVGQTVTDTINKFIHDGRDCQNYPIVKIGNQWWMQKNLNAAKYADGSAIPNVTGNTEWYNSSGALCYYNNDSAQYAKTYGSLYNWYAVNDARCVCPIGWHVPNDTEWMDLEIELGMSQSQADSTGWRGTDEGGKLKESGNAHWNSPNTGATNSSGFNALSCGYRQFDGIFGYIGNNTFWWTNSDNDIVNSWERYLGYDFAQINRSLSNKRDGFSVRCLYTQQSPCVAVTVTNNPSICDGQNITVGTNTYTASGTYTDTLQTSLGCDSIITTNLTVNPTVTSTGSVTVCSGDSLFLQGSWQHISGTYTDSLQTALGCDSIITTNLTVLNNSNSSLTQVACNSFTLNSTTYDTSGVYTQTITNAAGCDSTITLNLTINYSNTGDTIATACDNFIWYGSVFYSSGTMTHTFTNASGCDSVVTLHLTINNSTASTFTESACNSFTLNFQTYTTSGTYTQTLTNAAGCDSVITLNLSINPTVAGLVEATVCQGQSYTLPDGSTATTAGIYIDTLQTVNGCDSIITTNLTVNPVPTLNLGNDTSICANASITIIAGGTGNLYHWNNGLNTSSITVSTSGNFMVTVTNSFGCAATDNITVSMYSPINITVNTVNTACGQQNGVASAFVTGGTSPYGYLWNAGDTTNTATNLNAGVYIVYVTDANHCQNSALGVVSTTNGPVISNTPQITNVSCFGGSDGTISITVTGGVLPYHFEWSTGDTINQNISNLTAGPYEIVVTDANNCQAVKSINVSQPSQLLVSISVTNATCGNADGEATATVTGGTSPYAYNWSNGNTTANSQQLTANSYVLTVTDSHSCTMTASAAISETGAATVVIDSVVNSSCGSSNGAVYISVSGGTNFDYNWSDLSTSQDLTGVVAGTYNVTVTSSGCNAIAHATITEIQPLLQPICIVSVDNTTLINRNMLIWEKQQTTGISHYKIWKETTQAGVYQVVTTIPYAAMSKWTDPNSNPHQRSWRYKISAVDSCGTESPLSIVHKTMHLTVNLGQGQDINLIWNHYQGFDYYTYYIHRYRPSTGWMVIDSIPGDLNTYTDTPIGGGSVRYFVAAKRDNECWSSGNAKEMSGPYSQSLSNIEDNGIIDVNIQQTKTDELICRVYPNPTNDKITIELSDFDIRVSNFIITDIHGKLIKSGCLQNAESIIDMSKYLSGLYFIKLQSKNTVIIKRIIKQ